MAEREEPRVVEFVIVGVTADGKPFRPSDWAERLCGVMSAFGGDHRMQYSPYVHPVTANGVRCVVVDTRLEAIEPMAYRFLVGFAKDNELGIRDVRLVSSEAGERGERLEPADHGEPSAHVLASCSLPTLQTQGAVDVPQQQ